MYIDIISKLFNIYYYKFGNRSIEWDFQIPKFYKKEQFKLNIDLVKDNICRKILESSDKNQYVFKVILNSFYKDLKRPIGSIDESMLVLFNQTVKEISKYIDNILNVIDISKTNLITNIKNNQKGDIRNQYFVSLKDFNTETQKNDLDNKK